MDYHKQRTVPGPAQCNPPFLLVGVILIMQCQCKWIAKHLRGLTESDSMLTTIRRLLAWIPFEMVPKLLRHRYKSLGSVEVVSTMTLSCQRVMNWLTASVVGWVVVVIGGAACPLSAPVKGNRKVGKR